MYNDDKTCWNCPAAILRGHVDFRGCGQSRRMVPKGGEEYIMIECSRRPELGLFEPDITFKECNEWVESEYGYILEKMRVLILGIDGYLGWPLAMKLSLLGCEISGIDNFSRRERVKEKGSHTAVPIEAMAERLRVAKELLEVDINFRKMDVRDTDKLREFIKEIKPESIVHYGEIPSAPYSMVDMEHAIETQDNNVLGTLGLLWIMKEECPNANLIKLGTMGEYGAPLTGRPIFEGMFPADAKLVWRGREWSMGGEITPRDAVSLYHCSKVQDTFNVYECCKYWWIRAIDVMQGIIYGCYTRELAVDERLRTRFDFDEWFGTCINRFVSQAVTGIPLTIYGEGQQIRGMISLDDAMECMVRIISCPPEPGQYLVVNQVSGLHKILEIAETVAKVGKERGLDVKIQRLENPRVEAETHPLEVVSSNLPQDFGFEPGISLEKEVGRIFDVMMEDEIRERILKKQHVIIPETWWSGEHKKSGRLELYEPGTKKIDGHVGVLDVE